MKKVYNEVNCTVVAMISDTQILGGSLTDKPMKIKNVTVEEYIDGGSTTVTFD